MGEIGNYFIHYHGLDKYPVAVQEHFSALFALPRSSLMTLSIEKLFGLMVDAPPTGESASVIQMYLLTSRARYHNKLKDLLNQFFVDRSISGTYFAAEFKLVNLVKKYIQTVIPW